MPPATATVPSISLLCVDDHPIFRTGLATILNAQPDMRLVAQAVNACDGVAAYLAHRPDVTLMDLRLPDADGATAVEAIRRHSPEARVIVLTTADAGSAIRRALRAGAVGYLFKSVDVHSLLGAIRAVHRGARAVAPDAAANLAAHHGEGELTARELEVLALMRDGCRNKQVAARLGIAETTVNFHVRNVVEKLQAHDRTHAVAVAIRRGLLSA